MRGLFLIALLCVAEYLSVDSAFVGGYRKGNVTDDDVRRVHARVLQITSEGNGKLCKEAMVLKSVEKQVVAGVNYKLTYELRPQKCSSENGAYPVESSNTCEVWVWSRPWLSSLEITFNTCAAQPVQEKRNFRRLGKDDHDTGHMGMFKKFVRKYKKLYGDEKEFKRRFKIFHRNMKKVKQLQDNEMGTAVYGATQFADLTAEEFRKFHLGLKPELAAARATKLGKVVHRDIPDSFDWRTQNAVTEVKNQGMCGSCWAFSVTGNIEGQLAIKNKQLLSFSEQELVDCDKMDNGCEGGYMTNAYDQIIKLGGLELESDYPYDGADDQCRFSKSLVKGNITGYVNVSQDENDMAQWLVQNGPISIGINANVMQFYFGGVSHPWKFLCDPSSIDHGVLIVGYGTTTSKVLKKTLPYWIVKNSWGKFWGEQGYYRVYRGDGTCGVNLMASSAVVN